MAGVGEISTINSHGKLNVKKKKNQTQLVYLDVELNQWILSFLHQNELELLCFYTESGSTVKSHFTAQGNMIPQDP